MKKNLKFFVFSEETLRYREIRYFSTKLAAGGLLVAGVLFGIGHVADALGFDRTSRIVEENRTLKDQLKELSQKAKNAERRLEVLAERGNELRLMVDLSEIDKDTREAAVGGSVASAEFGFLSGDAVEILSGSRGLIEKLEREVKLQQTSYEEIQKKYESNRAFFSHLPAIKPSEGYYSVRSFGMRVHPVLRVYRMHEGIDIINDVGTNVYASGDGVVHFSGRSQGGYGIVVEISHGYGYTTLYAHLSKVLVRSGQKVKRGELIAKSGRSGLVSGPHLHYEVRLHGRRQNPVDYFFDDISASRYRMQLVSAK